MDLVKVSIDYFLSHISVFFYVWLVPALVSVILNYFYPVDNDFYNSFDLELMIITLGSILIGSLLSMLSYIGYIFIVTHPEEKSISVILSYAFDNAFKFLLTGILMCLVIFLGLIFFIIPGIVFMIWFIFVPMIVLLEQKNGTEALSQSKLYVSGRFFNIIKKIIFFCLVCMLYYIAMLIIVMITGFLNEYLLTVLLSLLSFPITCIGVVFTYQLYLDTRKEFEASTQQSTTSTAVPTQTPVPTPSA